MNTLQVFTSAHIALEAWARVLVLFHAAAAIVLIGSATHHMIIAWGYLRQHMKLRLGRIYAQTLAIAYVITFFFGALAYPTYRYYVRGLFLDRHEQWASVLFDIKEDLAALGLPLVMALVIFCRGIDHHTPRPVILSYCAFATCVCAIVWFNLFSGLLITLVKGV